MIHKFTYSQNCLFEFFKTLTTKMLVFLNPELENFMSYQQISQNFWETLHKNIRPNISKKCKKYSNTGE
jgi:hypothetical protein